MRASCYKILGTALNYGEAAALLRDGGDCAVVQRNGTVRQLVMKCPDGCGEVLSINLDRRSGPAWRLYTYKNQVSLFPSIDRPTGCKSHFILSRGTVIWCDWYDWMSDGADVSEFEEAIQRFLLKRDFTSFVDIAEAVGAVPWDALRASHVLARKGVLCEGRGRMRSHFKLAR